MKFILHIFLLYVSDNNYKKYFLFYLLVLLYISRIDKCFLSTFSCTNCFADKNI